MTGTCIVPKCHSRYKKRRKKAIVLHNFPKDPRLREVWLQFCKRIDCTRPSVTHRVCSLHFIKEDYYLKPILKEGAFPSVYTSSTKLKKEDLNLQSMSKVSLSASQAEKELQDVKVQLIVTESDLEKQIELRKLAEKRLQDAHLQLLRAKGGLASESNRRDAILQRALKSEEAMKKIFTPKQVKFLATGKRPQQWDLASIIKGIRLRVATSKRIYKYLRETENLPIPSFPSLSLWIRETFSLKPGITHSIKLLHMKASLLAVDQRNVILVFGEMSLNPVPCYDPCEDQVYGPCNTLFVITIQSVNTDWSQPIFFNLDCDVSKILLCKVINDVESTGLQVRGIVSQVSPKTMTLWRSLNVSYNGKTSFTTSGDKGRNVWVFGDTNQLMMSLRDSILQLGMFIDNQPIINYQDFTHFFKILESLEWRDCPKLTWDHISVTGQGRSQVNLAAQLISSTVAHNLKRFLPNKEHAANFIGLTDEIFDILSTGNILGDKLQRKSFARLSDSQLHLIRKFKETILSAQFGFTKDLHPFQEGLVITLSSLIGLYTDITEEYKGKSNEIQTSRLSLNSIDSVFTKIRANDENFIDFVIPNPVEAKARLRTLVIDANNHSFTTVTLQGKMTSDEHFNNRIKKSIPEFIDELLQKTDPDCDVLLPNIVTPDIDQKYAQLLQEVRFPETVERNEAFGLFNSLPNILEYTESSSAPYIPVSSIHPLHAQAGIVGPTSHIEELNGHSIQTVPVCQTMTLAETVPIVHQAPIIHTTHMLSQTNHHCSVPLIIPQITSALPAPSCSSVVTVPPLTTTIPLHIPIPPQTSTLHIPSVQQISIPPPSNQLPIVQQMTSFAESPLIPSEAINPQKKRKRKDHAVDMESTWVKSLTRGVVKLNSKWAGKFRQFEETFNQFHNSHPDNLSREPKVIEKLVKTLSKKYPKLDTRILKRYARLRTTIRIRYVIKTYTQQQITIHIPY